MSDAAPAGDGRELMARALRELQRAQRRIDELEARERAPIAIVGAGCRLPGGIDSPAALWQLLQRGGDATGPIPGDRWDVEHFHDPRPGQPGRITPRRGAFLDRIDGFDAAFFGIVPREAELMDPQQRLLLECSWHAFEDAGIAVDSLRQTPVGVFVGISTIDYAYHLVQNVPPDAVTAHCGTGTAHAVAAGRLAYHLDLRGPCLALDTACSSSLVALHLACTALRQGECDYALVAGVNAMLSPLTGASFSHARMLAPDGRCKTFAAAADGYARGEGVVALLLARAGEVATRGLRARAEIVGSAVNQDGRSAGLTVPNGPAQAAVIRRALAMAQVPPAAVDVVEAHGTGTALGDPIELQALASVFGEGRPADRPLLVSSIKTNLGHTEAAAGALSVLKAVLQLEHGEVAPHLHFDAPNPHVPWQDLPLRIPTQRTPWPSAGRRHAGVSSFGFSGTNAHAVLRSVEPEADGPAAAAVGVRALPLAAADAVALRALAAAYAAALRAEPSAAMVRDLTYTAAVGRSALRVRSVVLGRTAEELAAGLQSVAPRAVVQAELDADLAALATSYTAGDAAPLLAWIQGKGGRRVAAPAYPFQWQRYWCERAAPAPLCLTERLEPLAAATAVAAGTAGSVAVSGALPPAMAAALQAAGATIVNAADDAESWLFAAPATAQPSDAVAVLAEFANWLARASARARPPRLLALVAAGPAESPVAAGVRAALRAAAAERPDLASRWVAADGAAPLARVAARLLARDREHETVVRGNGEFAVRWQRVDAAGRANGPQLAVGSYLITGGAGALGQAIAAWLLERGVRHLHLLQRRAQPVPAPLAAAAARLGATVTMHAGDVADAAVVARTLAAIDAAGVALVGVVHLAGVLDDARLGAVDAARALRQLQPKLLGAVHLHEATRARQLARFVCISSAAAWLGNAGQTVYAAANGAVEGLCELRRAAGLPANAIAFGPWRNRGFAAAPGVAAHLDSLGIRPLDAAAALAALGAALADDAAARAVVGLDEVVFARAQGGVLPPRCDGAIAVSAPRAPATARTALQGDALARACADVVADVLGQPRAAVALDTPLAAIGLDSLLAVDVRLRLEQDLGCAAPLGQLLGARDCRGLAAMLSAPPAAGAPAAPAAADADLLAFVAQLSDDQVRAMLADPPPLPPPRP